MQLQVQQPDLAQMFGQDSLYNTLYGMQRQDQANANQNQNLGQAQQEQQFQAQDQPFNLQQLAANVGHTQALTGLANAQTPGAVAESTMKTNAADIDTSTKENQRAARIKKIAAGMSEDEAKQHQAQATSDLFATLPNGTPDIAKRRDAQMVLQSMPDIVAKIREINAEGANQANVANINQSGANQRDINDINAGKYNKNTTAYLMMKGFSGNYQQQAGAWEMKAAADEDSGDTASAMKARQMAALARASDVDSKAAAAYTALSKSPDFASLGLKPAVAPSSVAPKAPGMADAMNPGATPQPLPQANTSVGNTGMVQMKDRAGVPHMVPKANMQKALNAGWTQ
jgi:hypothetical protein